MQLSVIDVSEHQGQIDWNRVKNAGIAGAMIRSGYGVKNPNQIDKQFHNNLAGCKAVSMSYGFYHYSYAMNPAEAEREADFCLEIIAGSSPQYPVAFDMEESRQSGIRQICMRRYCDCVLQEDSCSRIHTHAVYQSELVA